MGESFRATSALTGAAQAREGVPRLAEELFISRALREGVTHIPEDIPRARWVICPECSEQAGARGEPGSTDVKGPTGRGS